MATGQATGWPESVARTEQQRIDNNYLWSITFRSEGPEAALERLTGIVFMGAPDQDPKQIRDVLYRKQSAGIGQREESGSSDGSPVGKCVLCRIPFGAPNPLPMPGEPDVVVRNSRNPFYCNSCDGFIRICPARTKLDLPVMAVDVKNSETIMSQVSIDNYSEMIAEFQVSVMTTIHEHGGFILNTMGDAVIACWPSGFIPPDQKAKLRGELQDPATPAAKLALRAASALQESAPFAFDGSRLPYRGAVDCSEMLIFSVESDDPILIRKVVNSSPSAFGTAVAVDVVGRAIVVASRLASHPEIPGGKIAVTQQLDEIAEAIDTSDYLKVADVDASIRFIFT